MGLEKAKIINKVTGEEIKVLFNPNEYIAEKSNTFAEVGFPGLEAPLLQFVKGGAKTLSMELFFDSYEEGEDVREKYLESLLNLLEINSRTHAPPVCEFKWGSSLSFTAILEKASVKYTMFLSDGKPVRATANVTFKEFFTESKVKRESADHTKTWLVKEGETLSFIAWQVYGDPAKWRPIARTNRIENPRKLKPGIRLVIPKL
jgi:hypothetical protein